MLDNPSDWHEDETNGSLCFHLKFNFSHLSWRLSQCFRGSCYVSVTGFDEQRVMYFMYFLGRICNDFQASSELHQMKRSLSMLIRFSIMKQIILPSSYPVLFFQCFWAILCQRCLDPLRFYLNLLKLIFCGICCSTVLLQA